MIALSTVALESAEWFQLGLEGILLRYIQVRSKEHFDASHPLRGAAKQLRHDLEATLVIKTRPHLKVLWSFGQGKWARMPWFAVLDERVARGTSDGVYVVYLFREDISGVYATLNQGITREKQRLGTSAGRASIRRRSEELRRFGGGLEEAGFMLSNDLDLHTEHETGKEYQHGTIAHRLYEASKLPPTLDLLKDLQLLVEAYHAIVRSELARRT
jgi:hypothetical protein